MHKVQGWAPVWVRVWVPQPTIRVRIRGRLRHLSHLPRPTLPALPTRPALLITIHTTPTIHTDPVAPMGLLKTNPRVKPLRRNNLHSKLVRRGGLRVGLRAELKLAPTVVLTPHLT